MAPILAIGIILPWFITLKYISLVSAYIYLVIFTVIEVYALTAMANLLVKFDMVQTEVLSLAHHDYCFLSQQLSS